MENKIEKDSESLNYGSNLLKWFFKKIILNESKAIYYHFVSFIIALTESSPVSLKALIASALEHFVYYITIFILSGLIPSSFKSSACYSSCFWASFWTGS